MNQEPVEKFILIDTDAGGDDAWAIFIAVAAHRASSSTGINIVGLTTTCGNASVENVSENVTRTLLTVDENTLPIYKGMSEYMMIPFKHLEEPPYNGDDGFGDASLPDIPPRLEAEHAVAAIIRLAEEYKGKLTIIALGPLTNLAMAIKLKPEIKGYIKEVFILGGNMDGLGNTTSAAEFNFFVDPEAAAIVVNSYPPCPLIILPWEICLTATSTYAFRTETLRSLNTPQIQLMDAVEAKNLDKNRESWLPPDAVLMACALDNAIILERQDQFAGVEVNGTLTRGMLVVDKARQTGNPPNIQLITKVNVTEYEGLLIWAAGGAKSSG
ncbi:hypothetical protein Ocin01_17233 [Orchesella cincta]|uniref:Inosine/uridine-preferring nucleoside hydrolase domain-containing protein n=1 Tax=Orchesella cincta TaxID=48709 RepID=A0A1D2M8Y6_ORCCI|nr:hypothetical protein Ocin01_17233 [Orchesella cincta]